MDTDRKEGGRKLSSSSSATGAGGGLHGGTLAFADDESTTKTIEVAVLEDTHDEGEKDADAEVVDRLRRPGDLRRGDGDDREHGPDAGGARGAVRAGGRQPSRR